MTSAAERELRDVLARFATGVAVVTALGPEGRPVGVTVNSFTSVSLDPPLVLFGLDRTLRSLPVFREADACAVNILGAHHKDLCLRFATAGCDKFAGVGYRMEKGAPVLEQALAVLHCTPYAEHEAGDHLLFVCRVEGWSAGEVEEPLVFFGGGYRVLGRAGSQG